MHQACRNGRLQIVKVLIEKYKATPDETKSVSSNLSACVSVAFLFDYSYGYTLLLLQNSGMTALHIAAEGGHVDIVKYFVEECKIQGDIPDVVSTCVSYSSFASG